MGEMDMSLRRNDSPVMTRRLVAIGGLSVGVLGLAMLSAGGGRFSPVVAADRVGDLPPETRSGGKADRAVPNGVFGVVGGVGAGDATSRSAGEALSGLEPIEPLSEKPLEQPIEPPIDTTPLDPKLGVAVQDSAVRFAEELNVPSTESGLIALVNVTVGQSVAVGDAIGRLDDRSLKIRNRAAQLRLSAAQEQVNDDLELRYAETARAEAVAELEASRSIYNESSGAVPLSNLRRLRLAVERAELEVARAHKAARQAQIEIDLRAADLAIIDDTMRRLQLTSPISGVVLQVFKQRGEWVASGEAVVRLARLDRLQVQALMSAEQCSPNDCMGHPVSVSWVDPVGGQKRHLRGRVTAVQPQRLAGGRYRIQAEIVNARGGDGKGWLLHPGTEVEMTVYPPKSVSGGAVSGGVARRPTGTGR
jgi:multidrug efflux pump subunit AcrA (membrane-fusion protein)